MSSAKWGLFNVSMYWYFSNVLNTAVTAFLNKPKQPAQHYSVNKMQLLISLIYNVKYGNYKPINVHYESMG